MVKQVESEADLRPLSTANTKNERSYTSAPPIRLHGVQKKNFTVNVTFIITFTVTYTCNFAFTSIECQGQIVALLCRVRVSRAEISDHGRSILSHCRFMSVRLSVCIGTAPNGRISVKSDIANFSENLPTKSVFDLQEDVSTFPCFRRH